MQTAVPPDIGSNIGKAFTTYAVDALIHPAVDFTVTLYVPAARPEKILLD